MHQHIGQGAQYIKNVEQLIGAHAARRLPDPLAVDHTRVKARGEERTPGPGHRGARGLRTAPFRLRRWVWWQRFRTRRG